MNEIMAELPGCVERVAGVSGLPALRVDGPRSSGVVQLQGAQVTSFVPRGGREMLWVSPLAEAGSETAIRGGVPVCFPWFGAGASGDLTPSHGPARRARWRVRSVVESDEAVVVTLVVTPDAVSRLAGAEHWPEGLFATLEITFAESLGLRFTARNEGAEPARVEVALHTYLAVDDVRDVAVTGLGGARMLDQVTGAQEVAPARLTFGEEVDVVVTAPERPIALEQGQRPVVRVERSGLPDAVVWNPGAAKAGSLADVPDGAWPQFICIEAAAVKDGAVTLAAGEHAVLDAVYAPEPA